MTELKTCPFCGEKAVAQNLSFRNSWQVVCIKGCILMPAIMNEYFTSREQAIKAWNKRVPLIQITGVKELIKKAYTDGFTIGFNRWRVNDIKVYKATATQNYMEALEDKDEQSSSRN